MYSAFEDNMNYEQTIAAQAAQQDKVARDKKSAEGWNQILGKYPLRDTQANFAALLEWANQLTLEAFEELIRTKPSNISTLDATSREGIIDDIVQHSHGDSNTLRQLRLKLSTYSLGQLRDKRRAIDFKSAVQTKEQAKAYVKEAHADNSWNGLGYPKLQSTIVPPGQVRAIPTGEFLRSIAKTDLWLFKRYVRLYSVEQINYWLAN